MQLFLEIDFKEVIKVKRSHTGGSWFSMLSAWEIRTQTYRRTLDMSREVDNGALVGTVPARAVILDSQPAELQGNECCCWSCQLVVIHYGRGGRQGSKEMSQHDGFPRGFLPALGCSCLQGGSLAASLHHTGLFFWWRWRGSNTDLTK